MYCAHGVHATLPMVWMLHSFGRELFCLSSSAPLRVGGVGVSLCASDDNTTGWVWVWDALRASIGFEGLHSPLRGDGITHDVCMGMRVVRA
jgi:hypothetical protein